MNKYPKWQTIASEYVLKDRWLTVRADTCVTPVGDTVEPWYVLEYNDWVSCVAIDKNDQVTLLRHYRQGVGEYVPEIVSGNMDVANETAEQTIRRELQEEIGYEGGEIYKTGATYANPSSHNNTVHSFLVIGGTLTTNTTYEIGADFTVEVVPFKDFVIEVTNPQSTVTYQGLNLASIFFALNFIRNTNINTPAIARLREIMRET